MKLAYPSAAREEKAQVCERIVSPLRFAVVLLSTVVYPMLGLAAGASPHEAWILLWTCALYSAAVLVFRPYQRLPYLVWTRGLSALDAVYTLWWLHATGGLYSPFYGSLYICMIAIALRHDFVGSLVGAQILTLGYFLVASLSHQLTGEVLAVAISALYLFLVGLAGALVSRQLLFQDEELYRTNSRLQTEIAEREKGARQLRKLVNELERSNQALENFAYVASHDLTEPLRMVNSYCVLLEKRFKEQLGPDGASYIHFALDGARRMKEFMDAILALSRVQRLPWSPNPVSLEEPLKTALLHLRSTVEETAAKVTWDPLPVVKGQEPLLALVFQNLIGNSIKFNHSRPPHVHISGTETTQGWRISVRDNGIGIPTDLQPHLFVLFRRLHTRTEFSGTGLGLAICKEIVEKHRGRIWIESTGDNGSIFYFTLKAVAEEATGDDQIMEKSPLLMSQDITRHTEKLDSI